ncbi:hypothetical protein AU255_09165 [Methyloprofundus sedimenti]|uniref:Uncharacterized protein n=1 Tax=Methyloprofundus sedimenti TaxID=1420851 RepID=A0A1V8M914_9GAMM|nr:hypothetical protein [Methyloprofundus sedimenti]OQK18007.1 hypothetical protein AU255_09165 [Methyloprofundus sedimenti]
MLNSLLTHRDQLTNIAMPLTHSGDGICSPVRGRKAAFNAVFYCPSKIIEAGLVRFNTSLVDCIEQPLIGLAVSLYGTANLIQSTSKKIAVLRGGLFQKQGHKPMLNYTQNPHNISVSAIKKQSIQKQLEIISQALTIFCFDSSKINKDQLKQDALELARMLDEIEHDNQRKTSRFNVLAKGTRRLIAERVTFNQAKQYPDCIVKFSCMEASL